jgi:hypothetical protein
MKVSMTSSHEADIRTMGYGSEFHAGDSRS